MTRQERPDEQPSNPHDSNPHDMRAHDPTAHPLDLATRLDIAGEGLYRGQTSPAYANMVGPFGGVIAAALLNAAWIDPRRLGEPVALTVNFAGPLAEGEFTVNARAVRTNRSTQHWSMDLVQGGEVAATATAVLATRRQTWSATEVAFPSVPAASELQRASTAGRPVWTQRYDMRFVHGALSLEAPHEAPRDSVSTLWMRDEPRRPLDFVSLAALCDAFFPRIFVRRQAWTPIGTVSMTTYFHADSAMLAAHGDREVLGTAHAHRFGNGYFDQTAQVWSPDGELFATTHQVVYFKA